MSQLPQGWELKTFGDVLSLVTNGVNGKQNKEGVGVPVSRIETIADQKIDLDRIGYLESYDEEKIEKYRLQENDILFSHINSALHLGKTAIVPSNVNLYHGVNLLRLAVNELAEPRYFNYYCKYFRLLGEFSAHAQHAVNQSSLNQKKLKAFNIPLAPIQQQKRIADKLDSVLAKVEAAQARLDKIPTILKRFRQSVLAAATSGELTKDWREENNVDIDDWRQSKLSDVSKCLDPNPSHRYPKADSSGVPILSTQQFVGLDSWTTDKAKLVNREFFLERKEKTKFLEDDIIFARKGRLGLARMAPKGFDYVYSHTVFIVRASGVNTDYLLWLLRQDQTVNWLLKEMNSNTGVPTLGKAIFEKLPVPLPSEEEQVAIVNKVNELFEHANTIEKQYNAAKSRLDKLTQSILAKAFRGELIK